MTITAIATPPLPEPIDGLTFEVIHTHGWWLVADRGYAPNCEGCKARRPVALSTPRQRAELRRKANQIMAFPADPGMSERRRAA